MERLTRRRLLIAVTVLVVAFAGAAVWLVRSQGAYYRQVGELAAADLDGKVVKVGGRVVPDSIASRGSVQTFVISDLRGASPTVEVRYAGIVPDTFGPHADVVVLGTYDAAAGLILADELQTKCPSRYEASRSPTPRASPTQ
jgi:cytochrome c-type biogenesis protein CcmE